MGASAAQAQPQTGGRDFDILGDGHVLEQASGLKSSRDAALAEARCGPSRRVDPAECDPPFGWSLEAGQAIDQGGLAGTVRTDQTEHLMALHGEADV